MAANTVGVCVCVCVCVCVRVDISFFPDEMSSNKDKRLSYLRTMQAHEYKTEHSVRHPQTTDNSSLYLFHSTSLPPSLPASLPPSLPPSLQLIKWLVIPLLSKAVSHFKDHNSERMISLLSIYTYIQYTVVDVWYIHSHIYVYTLYVYVYVYVHVVLFLDYLRLLLVQSQNTAVV